MSDFPWRINQRRCSTTAPGFDCADGRRGIQFPTGFGSVMKTSIFGSLDASGTVQWRLPESRVNCCWRADKAIGVGSYAQQQDNL